MNYNNIELITPPEPPQSFYAGEMEYNKKLYACLMSMYGVLSSLISSVDSLTYTANAEEFVTAVDDLPAYEPEVAEPEDMPLSSADADTVPEVDSEEDETDADSAAKGDSIEPEPEPADGENVDEV